MVSGSDQHGTPITLRAEQEGGKPKAIVDKYHQEFLDCWKGMGIDFDIFTSSSTNNHKCSIKENYYVKDSLNFWINFIRNEYSST